MEEKTIRHGRWKLEPESGKYRKVYSCSECGRLIEIGLIHWRIYCHVKTKPNYCPDCGAKMDNPGED